MRQSVLSAADTCLASMSSAELTCASRAAMCSATALLVWCSEPPACRRGGRECSTDLVDGWVANLWVLSGPLNEVERHSRRRALQRQRPCLEMCGTKKKYMMHAIVVYIGPLLSICLLCCFCM